MNMVMVSFRFGLVTVYHCGPATGFQHVRVPLPGATLCAGIRLTWKRFRTASRAEPRRMDWWGANEGAYFFFRLVEFELGWE